MLAKQTILAHKERLKILEHFPAGNSTTRHNEIAELRQDGTGSWLLEKEEFSHWMEGESNSTLLWAHGPGLSTTH
jgi:hypothetical protein